MIVAAPRAGSRPVPWWPLVARALLRAILRPLFRMRLEGEAPAHGPYLLVANHQGWMDPFLIVALFPAAPRIHFVGDRKATMAVWWKRIFLRSLGIVVPVARDGGSDRPAIETALRLLSEGHVVAIFPEGSVSETELESCRRCLERGRTLHVDGESRLHRRELAPFRRGVGYLALKARVPVVPVWLRGTAELYLGRELLARVGAPTIPVGPLTKDATIELAAYLHAELSRMATPYITPEGVTRRWRWLTHLF